MRKIKYHIVKFVFSIIGLYKATFKFKKGHKYYGGIQPNTGSVYRGDRTFYETLNGIEPTQVVQICKTRNKQYTYWELGLLKWVENNNIEEVK